MVKIIIVNYNSEKWIDRCLSSIDQAGLIKDTIIIDNASTDDSLHLIERSFPQVELIKLSSNLGFGQANNIGIKKAYDQGSDYVFLMNQDVYIEPNTIDCLISTAKLNPDFGILSPVHLNGNGSELDFAFSNYIIPSKCKKLYSDIFLQKLAPPYELPFVNAAAWLLTRKCIEKVGGFNPSLYHYGEDDNYCQRVLYHGLKIGIVPQSVIYHDREYRVENKYFDNSALLYERKLTVMFSDPFNDTQSVREIYIHSYKLIIKSLLTFRLRSLKNHYGNLKTCNSLDWKMILNNKKQSITQGKNFL
ncbi:MULTISPECIES: glycosyltransferase family 2 protein [unclassified Chryseobacterium]|uniref:glycosyltransferase family 2 protein n=1 Tax=unclassified Chryseobacterium TaxID=2593645 RepID=UPI000954CD9A|nr:MULTISPECIES: glycosyltransferase family 2 protein [unclassified Chryseobacterium]PXW17135.1 GT2 family glycosyltransferase [Chryseobacterium sp. CBTAP 102]SIQ71373.1 Glycosyltransferase, GT2 family [Chryseobacterium sp. RU33C]